MRCDAWHPPCVPPIRPATTTPIPDGPLAFEDIAMVRFFQERFFSFDDIADLQRHAARIAS